MHIIYIYIYVNGSTADDIHYRTCIFHNVFVQLLSDVAWGVKMSQPSNYYFVFFKCAYLKAARF